MRAGRAARELDGSAPFEQLRRPLALFVRGLLGREVALHSAPEGLSRSFANEHGWFFPAAYPMYGGRAGRELYFAAAAHLAAHARFGAPRFARGELKPIQLILISLFEDARVERRLASELPGLRRIWGALHTARPTDHPTFPALCARIARALCDGSYVDGHPLVLKARGWFDASADEGLSVDVCRRWGSLLGNDVGQLRLPFNGKEYVVEPAYRDDHRLLWDEPAQSEPAQPLAAELLERVQARARAGGGGGGAGAGAGAQPPAAKSAAGSPATSAGDSMQAAQQAPAAGGERAATSEPAEVCSYRYPEYDYQIGCSRPDFCTVLEQTPAEPGARAGTGASGERSASARGSGPLARRLRVETLRRRRRQPDGDALDLDAAIAAQVALRAGHEPESRLFVRSLRQRQSMALLILLDLSASTGDLVPATAGTLLELERDACLLLGELLSHGSDTFAIHGFSSDGRQRVEYQRLKELDGPWDQGVKARLMALRPRLSTRMGAALRHAARTLRSARAERRLILLLTDGAPSDVDAPDPAQPYLLLDARHAVAEARRAGVGVFAVSLDRAADRYVSTVFGPSRYLVLDRLERLPQVLSSLYARLAG